MTSSLVSRFDCHNHKPTSDRFAPGAVSGAGAVGVASSGKREAGWEEVGQASGDPKDGRGDVATQCDRRLPGQIQSELPFPACLFVCLYLRVHLVIPAGHVTFCRVTAGKLRQGWRQPGSPWKRKKRFHGSRRQQRTRSATRFSVDPCSAIHTHTLLKLWSFIMCVVYPHAVFFNLFEPRHIFLHCKNAMPHHKP